MHNSLLSQRAHVEIALQLLRAIPNYARIADELTSLAQSGRLRFDENLEERAYAVSLLGYQRVTLGPEVFDGSALSLAQTLVHERYHLRQNPLLKTVSFWCGIFTRTPVMRRYERPAYRAALQFLEAVAISQPGLRAQAEHESHAVRLVFESSFGPL